MMRAKGVVKKAGTAGDFKGVGVEGTKGRLSCLSCHLVGSIDRVKRMEREGHARTPSTTGNS